MLELRGFLEGGDVPVEVSEPAMDGGIPGADVSDVSLEVLDVDGIEAHDRRVQSYVCFGDGVTEIKQGGRGGGKFVPEVGFDAIEGSEQGNDCFLVGFLGAVWRNIMWSVRTSQVVRSCDYGAPTLQSHTCRLRC